MINANRNRSIPGLRSQQFFLIGCPRHEQCRMLWVNPSAIHDKASYLVKRNPLILPIDGLSDLELVIRKCDRITPDGVKKLVFCTNKDNGRSVDRTHAKDGYQQNESTLYLKIFLR